MRAGGFSGQWGEDQPNVKRKRALLESEGVTFDSKGRVTIGCLHSFGEVGGGEKTKAGAGKKRKR